tara:strand:- start:5293 stop:7674 length:2382 start_codon:yes stop_codon:yes gene_type:complete
LFGFLTTAPFASISDGSTAPQDLEILEKAYELTVKGEIAEAESMYRDLASTNPQIGLPALSRFLYLAPESEKLERFLQSVQADETFPDELKTEVLIEADRKEDALTRLRASSPEKTDILAKAEFLHRHGEKGESIELLIQTILQSERHPNVGTWAEKLLDFSDSLAIGKGHFLQAFAIGHQTLELVPEDFLAHMDQQVFQWQTSQTYWEERNALFETIALESFSALAASIICYHEGNLEKAEAFLSSSPSSPVWLATATTIHKIRLLKALGRNKESTRLAATLLAELEREPSADQRCQAALQALDKLNHEQARLIFDSITPSELSAEALATFHLVHLRLAAFAQDFDLLISQFSRYASTVTAEVRQRGIDSTVSHLHSVEARQKLIDQIHSKVETGAASPVLYLLAAALEEQNGLGIQAIKSRWLYGQSNPDDYPAQVSLVAKAVHLAIELNTQPNAEVTADQVKQMTDLATESALTLIQTNPYNAEAMRALMDLYRKSNQETKAPEVPDLVGKQATNPKLLAHCAYVLATEGYPDKALLYYQQALEKDPGNPFFLMNRASCHTRLGRWDDAAAFYRQSIEQGFAGKPFHLHESLLRLWSIAEHQNNEEACLSYFRSLPRNNELRWQSVLVPELVALMVQVRRMDDATFFHEALLERFRSGNLEISEAIKSYQRVARGLVETDHLDQAEAFLESGLAEFPDHPEINLAMVQSLASLDLERGRFDAAIGRLEGKARDIKSPGALELLYFAGRLAEQNNQPEKATSLFVEFLESDSRNFELRASTARRLAKLRQD